VRFWSWSGTVTQNAAHHRRLSASPWFHWRLAIRAYDNPNPRQPASAYAPLAHHCFGVLISELASGCKRCSNRIGQKHKHEKKRGYFFRHCYRTLELRLTCRRQFETAGILAPAFPFVEAITVHYHPSFDSDVRATGSTGQTITFCTCLRMRLQPHSGL
jgi:hypothetical protein